MSDVPVRIVGEQPRPRVLLAWGDEGRDEMRAAIEPHAPTIREIEWLHEVNQADFDVLVTDRLFGDAASADLCVVMFASGAPLRFGTGISYPPSPGGPSASRSVPSGVVCVGSSSPGGSVSFVMFLQG